MANIIVVFPHLRDAENIRNLLVRNGRSVIAVCTSGASVIQTIDGMEDTYGIVISGYRYQDMTYSDLLAELPDTYRMIVMAAGGYLERIYEYNVVKVAMPVRVYELLTTVDTVDMTLSRLKKKRRQKPRERDPEEKAVIEYAKSVLMENRNMSEEEAHRYIQKTSMSSGTNMIETAHMIIDLFSGRE